MSDPFICTGFYSFQSVVSKRAVIRGIITFRVQKNFQPLNLAIFFEHPVGWIDRLLTEDCSKIDKRLIRRLLD